MPDWVQTILTSFLSLITYIALALLAWYFRDNIRQFLDAVGVKSIEVSDSGVKAERFDEPLLKAYGRKKLPPPSVEDRARIRDVRAQLAPFVAGARVLWVDDCPTGNALERSA